MKKAVIILLLILSLFLSGCFFNKQDKAQNEVVSEEVQNDVSNKVQDKGYDKVDEEILEDVKEDRDVIEEDILLPELIDENGNPITMENENVSITTEIDENSSIKTEVENKLGIDLDELPPEPETIEEWCIAGAKYSFTQEGGDIDATVKGPTTYNNKEVCEAESVTKTDYFDILATYYFTYAAKEMWIITDVAGQKSETYVTN